MHAAIINTDDTFQLAKAAKALRQVLESMTQSVATSKQAADAADVAISMLSTLAKYARHPWAKTSVDVVFRVAAQRRLLFTHDQRLALDAWTASLSARRSSAAVRSHGTVAVGASTLDLNPLRRVTTSVVKASKVVGLGTSKHASTVVPKSNTK